jgi:hypothetical protein
MNRNGKPTVEEILELYDKVESYYRSSNIYDEWDKDEELYHLDFKELLLLPKEFQKEGIVLPTARDMVDACVDQTSVDNLKISVGAMGDSKADRESREMLKKLGYSVVYRNNVEQSISPWQVGDKYYWTYGTTTFKSVWDADRYVDKPEKKDGESEDVYSARVDEWRSSTHDTMPIVIKAVHPKSIRYDPYNDPPEFAFETTELLVMNVKSKFNHWSNPEGRGIADKVKKIQFWTKDYRCDLYDREPVLKVSGGVAKHNYGHIPYTPVDTGLGLISADNDLCKRYVGILRYIRDILLSESRNFSLADILLKREIFPWIYLTGEGSEKVTTISQKYGDVQDLPPGVELHKIEGGSPPASLLQYMSAASQYIQGHAAPNVVRGLGESGVRSGSDRARIEAQASRRYNYANQAFAHGLSKVLSNCARIMKNVIPGDIYVTGKSPNDEFEIEIKKDKLREPFTFYASFNSTNPEDDYRKHDDLERQLDSGLITMQFAREQLPNVDPLAMERQEQKAMIKNSQAMMAMREQIIGMETQKAMAQIMAKDGLQNPQMMMPGMGQPQGQPPTQQPPGRRMSPVNRPTAPPGSAAEQENMMKQNRSQVPMSSTQGRGGGGNR